MSADPAAAYAALRDETAQMLKLDAANLSLVEGLQLDVIALLRLEIDGLHGAALSGETVDLQRLAVAHGMLQKTLGGALVAPAPAATNHDAFAGARAELELFLAGRASAVEHREQRESERLRARVAELTEEIEQLRGAHACRGALPAISSTGISSPPAPANVVPIRDPELERLASRSPAPKSAAERAEAERAKRDYINSSGSSGGVPGGVLGQPLPSWWGR
jgi:hypothetical protein